MLELRPNCECCDCDLPPEAANAMICTYECTFCADYVDNVLSNVCPNCGGGFVPRPIRPLQARRKGISRHHQQPSQVARTHQVHARRVDGFAARHKDTAPYDR